MEKTTTLTISEQAYERARETCVGSNKWGAPIKIGSALERAFKNAGVTLVIVNEEPGKETRIAPPTNEDIVRARLNAMLAKADGEFGFYLSSNKRRGLMNLMVEAFRAGENARLEESESKR